MDNSVNLRIGIIGDDRQEIQLPRGKALSKRSIMEAIKNSHYDDHVKAELVKIASNYPDNALQSFMDNRGNIITAIQQKQIKENAL